MEHRKKWRYAQLSPKNNFLMLVVGFIHSWDYKKRKEDIKTFLPLFFTNNNYIRQI